MLMTSIEIREHSGDKLARREAFWHSLAFAMLLSSDIGILVNLLVIGLTEKGQGLPDLLLGTAVFNRPE